MPEFKSDGAKAFALLVVSSLIWGGVFHVIKVALVEAPPFVVLGSRFTLTAVVLLPYLIMNRNYRLLLEWENFREIFILSMVGVCGYNVFFTYGMQLTEPSAGSLIIAANPAITTLLSRIWKKEEVSWIRWSGIGLAFVGLLFIVFQGRVENLLALRVGPGNLLLLGAPLVWAIYSIRSRDILKRMPATVFTAAIILFSLPPQIAMAVYQRETWHWAFRLDFWLAIAYLGILATGVAYLFWNKGVHLIGAARSSIFVNLIPVTALLISFALGHDLLPHHLIGGTIVILGVMLATRK